jgi:hypothetical protein
MSHFVKDSEFLIIKIRTVLGTLEELVTMAISSESIQEPFISVQGCKTTAFLLPSGLMFPGASPSKETKQGSSWAPTPA